MYKLTIHVLLLAFLMLFLACGQSKKTQKKNIVQLETELKNVHDTVKMAGIIAMYDKYSEEFPDDSLTPLYIYRSAEMNRILNKGTQALIKYDLLIKKYPESEYVPICYFLKGLVFENVLYNFNAAELSYREFIEKYPDHPLRKDAELSLKYLGKSVDEIIEMFSDSTNVDTIL